MWNRNTHNAVVGVFNCQGSWWCRRAHQFVREPRACCPVEATVCAVDVPGFGTPGPSGKYAPGDYALYRHRAGTITVLPARSGILVRLDEAADWEVVTVVPVKRPAGRGGTAFAAIGLASMLNSGGAVFSCELAPTVLPTSPGGGAGAPRPGAPGWNSSSRVVEWQARVHVRGGGMFAAYVNAAPRRCKVGPPNRAGRDHPFEWRRRAGGLLLVALPEDVPESWVTFILETDPQATYLDSTA